MDMTSYNYWQHPFYVPNISKIKELELQRSSSVEQLAGASKTGIVTDNPNF